MEETASEVSDWQKKAQAELIRKLKDSLARSKADYETLKASHADIQQKYFEWESGHSALLEINDRLARVNAEAAELMVELEEKNESLRDLNRRLATANAESAELMAELEEKNEVLLRTNKELARANVHAAELMAIIEIKDEQIQQLNQSLSRANALAAELVAEREIRMEDLKGTNKQLEKEIIELAKAQAEIQQLAFHDDLTGLPNRRMLKDRLRMGMAMADRHQSKIALLLFDLDDFKSINDRLGHNVGDKLLCAVGARMRNMLRQSDTIARLGGDEFTVLLTEIRQPDEAALVADRILAATRTAFEVDEHLLRTSASIGIAMYPEDADETDELIKRADIAMYRAKERGRDNFQFYGSHPPEAEARGED